MSTELADLFLNGVITDAPAILCRSEDAAIYIQSWMHTHLTKEPPVMVVDEWPKDVTADAVAITPLHVLGTQSPLSFRINVVPELKPDTQKVLNAMIRLATVGKETSIRNLAAAVYGTDRQTSKRKIDYAFRELQEHGLIKRVDERQPPKLAFGRWRADPAAAKAAGIDITEYE